MGWSGATGAEAGEGTDSGTEVVVSDLAPGVGAGSEYDSGAAGGDEVFFDSSNCFKVCKQDCQYAHTHAQVNSQAKQRGIHKDIPQAQMADPYSYPIAPSTYSYPFPPAVGHYPTNQGTT